MNFSDQFKEICKKKNILVKDAAAIFGVSRPHLSNVINGNTPPGSSLALAIFEFCEKRINLETILAQENDGDMTRIN